MYFENQFGVIRIGDKFNLELFEHDDFILSKKGTEIKDDVFLVFEDDKIGLAHELFFLEFFLSSLISGFIDPYDGDYVLLHTYIRPDQKLSSSLKSQSARLPISSIIKRSFSLSIEKWITEAKSLALNYRHYLQCLDLNKKDKRIIQGSDWFCFFKDRLIFREFIWRFKDRLSERIQEQQFKRLSN